jgi:ABC-type glycerol-3-phosphate transport system substrate-binding protein
MSASVSPNLSPNLSRRSFLKMAAATSAMGLLAACVAPVPGQPGAVPAAQGKVVRILLPSWATAEMPFDTAAREFNEANPGSNVQIQTAGEGWDTKVMSQIASDTLEWSGAGIASSASSSLPTWILTGMIQPVDDLIAASSVEGAATMLDDLLPILRQASTYEGKFYGIPYSYENISFNWRTDYFDAVGATEAPKNWDDWLEVAREIKKWGADQQIYPTSFIPDLDASTGTLISGSTTEPFDDDMLLKWEAGEGVSALAFYRQLVLEEELTPPHGFDGWLDAYYAGKVASVQAQSSRGVWGQLAFGTDKVTTSPVPTRVEPNAGTPFWGNCVAVLNKAPNAQEALDYFVYAMGPQNITFQKTAINTGKTPVYQSIYDNVINGDPQYGIYSWMNDMRDQVEHSVVRPFNNYFSIQDTHYRNFIVQLVEPGSTMTPEECAKAIADATREEISKQKA